MAASWTNLLSLLLAVIQMCNALPAPTPESPFSLRIRNARTSTGGDSSSQRFSLQESVARILRALAAYGYPDAQSTSTVTKRTDNENLSGIALKNRQLEENVIRASRHTGEVKAQGQGISDAERSRSRVIVSQPLKITEGTRGSGRSLKNIDVQGVRVIVGQRVPDDPQDKFFTWRNARVIKGILVPSAEDMKNVLKHVPSS